MNKCLGCGITLQDKDKEKIGYVVNIDDKLCQRCFQIKNYNKYKMIIKDNDDFDKILSELQNKNDLILLVVDLFMPSDISKFKNIINNNVVLVLTKRDLLPSYDQKLLDYFKGNYLDRIIISSQKNYNIDELYQMINKYKKSDIVYVVGYTNSGKSTLINKLIYNYTNEKSFITTSSLPATTLENINIKLNDLVLIDTPGIVNKKSIINFLEPKTIKKVIPSKKINPKVYQIKTNQSFIIEDFLQLIAQEINLIFYFSNDVILKRRYNDKELIKGKQYEFLVDKNQDIVIEGLGFIKCSNKGKIKIICSYDIDIYVRKSLI